MTRALVLLVVALASFGLVVAASADPPDPTWIAGFWDDDDQDNAVIAILAIPGWTAAAPSSFATFLVIDPLVVVAQRSEIVPPVFTALESRAPPLASNHLG
jgi:hypothetical protein